MFWQQDLTHAGLILKHFLRVACNIWGELRKGNWDQFSESGFVDPPLGGLVAVAKQVISLVWLVDHLSRYEWYGVRKMAYSTLIEIAVPS